MSMDWPRKGDKAFNPSLDPEDLTRLEAFVMPSDAAYIVGFQRAADMIVDVANSEDGNYDNLFFPVAYLYRHHLELSLKDLVRLGVRLGALKDCNQCLRKHNLADLWDKTKELIQAVSSTFPGPNLDAAEHVILELHKLDLDGQAFRYAKNKKGNPNLQGAPDRVDLNELKATVKRISRFLDALDSAIDSCNPGPP